MSVVRSQLSVVRGLLPVEAQRTTDNGQLTTPLLQLPNTYRAFYGRFSGLHNIQRQAIAPVLEGHDLILQSATGSGKTEAVLAPCAERIIRSGHHEALVYIVPTRALAFDLKRRFDTILTQRLGLRLGIRTGDIKRSGGERPDLMITTPESLDVMLGSANPDLQGFISRVRMMAIDEIHPFVYQYRGQQLSYLLRRLERRALSRVGNDSLPTLQKIAISATIADIDAVIRFFSFRADTVRIKESTQRNIAPHLIHLKDENYELTALLNDLYHIWKYRKILIFANSRGQCDRVFAIANRKGRFRGVSEIHYSNLKPGERRDAERRFRKRGHALCVATSTLELGIDVGDVDAVLLYEPPDSVSAFLQRIGRSNRRQNRIRFWGICRGERAGEQLLRFLGLLNLAREGAVESPLPKTLPSVLAQQIISCLYEKKRISLPAIQELFSQPEERLQPLFDTLNQRGWLRKGHINGLFEGGWRYRNCLFDRQIWSNFPETEEDYTLELSGEAIADLPGNVVRQLDPGDRVHIAGRRIRILQIDKGERKRVTARLADRPDNKEIMWLGTGCHVSYEVARSIRDLLRSQDSADNKAGLFARTRRLLQAELKRESVILANDIEVVRGKVGFYRYRTFLGSVGNLILEWAVKETCGEDIFVSSDEIGVDCSCQVDFRALPLPLDRKAFCLWVRQHFKMLLAPFSLNSFCSTLPHSLLIEELTDFLYDDRIAKAFTRYLKESSEIVSGDPGILDLRPLETVREIGRVIDPVSEESLLSWEKQRWATPDTFVSPFFKGGRGDFSFEKSAPEQKSPPAPLYKKGEGVRLRPLTGTAVGEYFRHRQCGRWFCFNSLPADQRPPRRTRVDNEVALLRMERGRRYERYVMDYLREQGETIFTINENDTLGNSRPLKERAEESGEQLQKLVQMAGSGESGFLFQGVFISEGVLEIPPGPPLKKGGDYNTECQTYSLALPNCKFGTPDGIGIPDLIRVSLEKDGVILTVGDIKSSSSPRYYQKWQVAFYALLLTRLIRSRSFSWQAEVAGSGFLLIPGKSGTTEHHDFDLFPYMAAFPMLFQNLGGHLSHSDHRTSEVLHDHQTCGITETSEVFAGKVSPDHETSEVLHDNQTSRITETSEVFAGKVPPDHQTSEVLPDNQTSGITKTSEVFAEKVSPDHETSEVLHDRQTSWITETSEVFSGKVPPDHETSEVLHDRQTSWITETSEVFAGKVFPDHETSEVLHDHQTCGITETSEVFAGKVPPDHETSEVLHDNQTNGITETSEVFAEKEYHLQIHCTTCDYFEFCYSQALSAEDIQFIPRLTPGELRKLRGLGLNTLETAAEWFETSEKKEIFSPNQKERIQGHLSALLTNQITVRKKKTHAFPNNISTTIFVHMLRDPVSSLPRVLGWRTVRGKKLKDARIWELEKDNAERDFSDQFLTVWSESITYSEGPHIVCFGARIQQDSDFFKKFDSHLTDLRQMLRDHFNLPIPGNLTLFSLSRVLGLMPEPEAPESLFHDDWDMPLEDSLILMENIWRWALRYLESTWEKEDWEIETGDTARTAYLRFIEEEKEHREEDILSLQDYTLPERVERFRAMGPMMFQGIRLDDEGRFLYSFRLAQEGTLSKFREGDFLRLAPDGTYDLQSGFPVILTEYDRAEAELSLLSRKGRLSLNKRIFYSLEEDASDWNTPKLEHVVRTVFSDDNIHPLAGIFSGQCNREKAPASLTWIQEWLKKEGALARLNAAQQRALELPFRYHLSLIEGPPGTGKTHLLGWILIALIRHAYETGRPLRIAVSALTHHAIDQVLKKVVKLVNTYALQDFPARCIKWGRWDVRGSATDNGQQTTDIQVEPCDNSEEILACPYLILGATGYGLYGLFGSRNGNFPHAFDWVIFDEASQMLVPQALLSLVYGKGDFLFLGDVKQLPPIVLGDHKDEEEGVGAGNVRQSLLERLLNAYASDQQILLNVTYRMNAGLCEFPSRAWYGEVLRPDPGNADSRLRLSEIPNSEFQISNFESQIPNILDPEKPVVLVLADHEGCHQESETEAEIMTQLAYRLIDTFHLTGDQIALISPHRAQNNAVTKRLGELLGDNIGELPLVDTAERMQGAERDVILFGFTSSDADHIMSEFLNNPNRFNVAITRAKHKLVVVGSRAFFSAIPHAEKALQANRCFKDFFEYCRERGRIFCCPLSDL
ncbi:AAA domain-containing protein [Desulfococcaceae bacterium HSG8]|nr:AAA domain-containing protein [Desulfococcaceae bacterium HSG8]